MAFGLSPGAFVIMLIARSSAYLMTWYNEATKKLGRTPSQKPDHTGIIVCTFDLDFVALARRIHDALAVQPDLNGQLSRINRPG